MKRRTFLKALPVGAATVLGGGLVWRQHCCSAPPLPLSAPPTTARVDPPRDEGTTWARPGELEPPSAALPRHRPPEQSLPDAPDPDKSVHFDRWYDDDYLVTEALRPVFKRAAERLHRAQRVIGHGHFNIISYDDLLRHARHHGGIGRFELDELAFLDELFFADARRYGFFGDRTTDQINDTIPTRKVQKIRGTGHYLLHGSSREKYVQLCRDLDDKVVLTSGVRGVVKQFQLFLGKAIETDGNLSQASRSLAPPGYSYHATGDFDVGKVGFGLDNFTEAFARTDEYRRLIDLGYVDIRYPERNPFGVRHEPWHIKIA